MPPVIHQEHPGIQSQGHALDISPRRVGKATGWTKKLCELLDSGRFDTLFIGARKFTISPEGRWVEQDV